MSPTWDEEPSPAMLRIGLTGWCRVVVRGFLIIATILSGLALLLPLRLLEKPIHGTYGPWTPNITRAVCRVSIVWMGLGYRRHGTPMRTPGAVVANHASWLDIFALNAGDRVHFVSKSEVASWPGIGALARSVGTVFIARDPRQARAQTELFEERLQAGQRLLFFPEGTSTDGLRVLPFKSTLFQAFFAPELRNTLSIQPVSVRYHAPDGAEPRTYGWWGDMSFGPHLIHTLSLAQQGRVDVTYHPPVKVADFPHRKALALAVEVRVRGGHASG